MLKPFADLRPCFRGDVMPSSKTLVPYVVRQGDYLTALAFRFGFEAEEIWNDPKNAELKAKRVDYDTLWPGDLLFLPKANSKPATLNAQATNAFAAQPPTVEVPLCFEDINGPWANEPYEVEGLPEPTNGTTDGDGMLVLNAPVTTQIVTLTFPKKSYCERLTIGGLDPANEWSGVQQRLAALGLYQGAVTAQGDLLTQRALRAFQERRRIAATGLLDQATVDALDDAYHLG
jgi:hypothetical protein